VLHRFDPIAREGPVEAGLIPLLFKEGWLRLNKKIPFLIGADGVVSKFRQNKVRFANIDKEAARPFTNHPAFGF